MSTNIKLKKSSIAGRIPSTSDLDYGELAINYADGKLFYKNSSNQIKSFIDSAAVQSLIDNVSTGGGGTDSASVISLILSTVDSDYIALREADVNGGLDSAAVLNLIPVGTYKGVVQSSYTATAGQASFSADYTVGQVLVYLNGLLLSPDDYIATNGTSVSLVVNADSGDEIRIVDIVAGGIDSSASLDLINSTIDSAYVAARGLKYTDFSVSVQAAGSPNLSFNNTNGVFSYTPPNLSSYVTTASLPSYGYTTYDSADTLSLVDSNYIQSKFTTLSESDGTLIVSGNILPDTDSTYSIGSTTKKFKDIYLSGGTVYIDDLGLSANENGTITIGQLDSIGVLSSIGVIATVDSEQVGTIVDSAYLAARLTNYVTDTELASFGYTTYDSTNTTGMLSGYATQSYVTTQINNLINGAPSTLDTLNEIAAALNDDDSAYATLVSLIGTKTDFDSADAIALITENDQQRDSAFITNIVDSAYIAARTSAGTDSATTIALIQSTVDSAYIAAREADASVGSGGLDSAAVVALVGDGTFRGVRTYEFTADSGQTAFSGADDNGNTLSFNSTNVVVAINGIIVRGSDYTHSAGTTITLTDGADSGDEVTIFNIVAGGVDSQAVIELIDSAYIAARTSAGTDSATVEAIVESYGYLTSAIDSANVITLITENDQQRDSAFVTGIVDTSYIQSNQITYNTSDFTDSAFVTGLPVSTFTNDANYTTYDSTNTTGMLATYATQSYVTNAIDSIVGAAPGALDTLNELAAALGDDANFSTTITNQIAQKIDSADAISIITSYGYSTYDSTNAAAQIEAYDYITSAIDSAGIINLIDSAYIAARVETLGRVFIDENTFIADSGQTIFNAAYVPGAIQVFLNGILLSSGLDYTATNGSTVVLTSGADSGDALVVNALGGDSARIESVVDSAYIQARVSAGTDSATVVAIIEGYGYSTYDSTNAAGQIEAYGYLTSAIDSVGVIALITANDQQRDSAFVTNIIDSAYIQTRQTTQDFAYSSLTGVPDILDSADVVSLITANDQQRDSSFVTGIIDSDYIAARTSAGTDSASVIALITSTVDSAYVALREANTGGGGLDSAAVLNIFPDGTYRGLRTYEFTADSGQITFTGADDRGNTLVYSNQNLILFLNGILLVDSADYTATDGSSIILTSGADSGDTVTAFNIVAGGEADSAAIQNEVLSFVDSAYITSRASDQGLYTTDSVTFAGLTINGITYPNTDGTANQVIVTDGDGALTFDDLAVDAVYVNVKNVSGGSLQKGLPLHQTGSSGNTLEVVEARADSAGLMPAVAILKDSLNAEEEGQAIISGKISGVNTSSFNEGDVIYVGTTGGYTNVKPAGEGLIIQNLGIVTRVDATHGSGVVLGAGRGAATPNLNDGNIFIGNSSNYSSTATLNTTIVPEGDNLYYTTARHDSDTLAQVDSAYVQQRVDFTGYATETYVGTSIDSAIDALVDGAPGALNTLNELAAALNDDSDAYNTLLGQIAALPDSAEVATIITSYGYSTYDSTNATAQIEAYGYITDAIDSARITSMLAADSFSIGGTIIGDGKIEIRNGTGSTPSYVDLYCEVSNAHYTRIQSEAHANYSGNVTLTTPTTSGTLALTSDVVDSAAIIALITANDQQRDSVFVTGIIDSDYINARVDAVSGTDSAATIALIEATVDSAYVAAREANTGGGSSGGLDSAAVIALIDLNGGGNNNLVFTTYDYIATADQSTFSGNDKDGNGLTYNSGSVQVYRNGILLVETDDYTASNGSSIILNTGADSGDYISIATFEASISSIGISSYEFVADSGQATFSGTATNGDVLGYTAGNLLVHLNGILLTDSDDYTATSGTSIVLGVAADSADLLHITTFAASSRSQWGATSASITAVSNKKYIVDTSSAITITLPSSPNFGDEIGVVDGTGNAGTNNITISSSNKILASDSDLTLDINRSGVTLTYYNSAQGWIITSTV